MWTWGLAGIFMEVVLLCSCDRHCQPMCCCLPLKTMMLYLKKQTSHFRSFLPEWVLGGQGLWEAQPSGSWELWKATVAFGLGLGIQ